MFSIIIPTLNNYNYLKICIDSIKKNSKFNHQIIVHVNVGKDETKDFLEKNNIEYTFTNYNSGLCEGVNNASKKANNILFILTMILFCQIGMKLYIMNNFIRTR